ncbi:MAG: arginine decarboxylase [Clostridia bacterium]|jgi:arginine/lysine/ornithine decarboxylase|nr:arginine decarboxylase [Clostridiales bacterium]MDK2985263.1 arginine decarboxylase [Clostridia bacterium]
MNRKQQETPIFTAVKNYVNDNTIPFHVPGHKQGRGCEELTQFLGYNTMSIDLTCFPDTDNILNPKGVIKEAQELAAQTFGADKCFFLTNGTTCGIQAMIMSVCKPGDKIIIPRNAHKSTFGGLVLSGALPIYIRPEYSERFGISMGVTPEAIEATLQEHPDTKAVFVINPNYYGTASNLKKIVEICHKREIPVLVDEAHGGHLHLSDKLPPSAMELGADLSASSTHKLLGSLTQSSMLFLREGLIDSQTVKSTLNITQTTSPSYILLSSLDVARKQIALHGREMVAKALYLAELCRKEIARIPGLELFEPEHPSPGCYSFDITKITVNVQNLGMSGYEVEALLRSKYHIQVELSDLYNVMFLISLADNEETIAYLVKALKDIVSSRNTRNVVKYCPPWPVIPPMSVSPQQARYSTTKTVPLEEAVGEVSAETIMAYPPGIPIVCPGEYITSEIVDYVKILKSENADLQGTEDPEIQRIKVLKSAFTLIEEEVGSAG